MPELVVVLYRLSESFGVVWPDFTEELGITFSIIQADDRLPGGTLAAIVVAGGEEENGLDLLPSLSHSTLPIFMVGTNASHRFGVEAVRRGAADYFALPTDLDLLRRTLAGLVEAGTRRSVNTSDTSVLFEKIIGRSPGLQRTLAKAAKVSAHHQVTVLISGETGTGKEVLARAIHESGATASGRFVPVNCAAIPSHLLESELFGHERGAFTDAHRDKIGLFEEANGGSLFLDEIGHMPLDLQGKLLRALEEKAVRRVGGSRLRSFEARIMTATHLDLRSAVQRGEFREDLYYRLNVVQLELPALRERGDDIDLLTDHFVDSISSRYNLQRPKILAPFRLALRSHDWPGNVRELRHAIERALLLSPSGTLVPEEMALERHPGRLNAAGPIPFPATLDEITVSAARATLDHLHGNKSAAARALGISRARLQRALDRNCIDPDHDGASLA